MNEIILLEKKLSYACDKCENNLKVRGLHCAYRDTNKRCFDDCEIYTEILKLKYLLKEENIPFEFIERKDFNGYQILYKENSIPYRVICSVIEHDFSYGNEEDKLEIQGLLTEYEMNNCGSVVGFLSAEDVFYRIKEHWYNNIRF